MAVEIDDEYEENVESDFEKENGVDALTLMLMMMWPSSCCWLVWDWQYWYVLLDAQFRLERRKSRELGNGT